MKATVLWFALVVGMTSVPAKSDTVTTKDHLSVNGTLIQMVNGMVELNARFVSGTKMIPIPLATIQNIEFNSVTFNPGPPPKVLGIGPPRNGTSASPESVPDNIVLLRDGEKKGCNLLKIDAFRVHCNKDDITYLRTAVLRVFLGGQ